MHKLITLMMSILLIGILFSLNAFAETKQSGLFTYEIKGNGTAKIVSFDWDENGNNDLYIPEMLDGYTVTELAENAFSADGLRIYHDPDDAIAAILPNTITVIGDKCFFDCDFIATINIPASVKQIGSGAFAGTSMKCSVDPSNEFYATIDGNLYNKAKKELIHHPRPDSFSTEPEIIPEGIKSIGDYAFYGADAWYDDRDYSVESCDWLNVILPSTVTEIGDYAFYGCGFDDGFIIPSSVREIGDYAFAMSRFESGVYLSDLGLYRVLYLPENVETIGEGAFYCWDGASLGPSSTQKDACIYLRDTKLTAIPDKAFSGCNIIGDRSSDNKMYRTVVLPNTIKSIGNEAFADAHIRGIYMSNALEEIGDRAFYNSWIEDIVLPNKLISIGSEAFAGTEIERLKLPESLEKIGSDFCDRTKVTLEVEEGSYASIWASENGYPTARQGGDDTSWLNG